MDSKRSVLLFLWLLPSEMRGEGVGTLCLTFTDPEHFGYFKKQPIFTSDHIREKLQLFIQQEALALYFFFLFFLFTDTNTVMQPTDCGWAGESAFTVFKRGKRLSETEGRTTEQVFPHVHLFVPSFIWCKIPDAPQADTLRRFSSAHLLIRDCGENCVVFSVFQ